MKKIISLFQRDYKGDRKVRDVVVEGAEWVLFGEGRPTRKFDGTCCMVEDGRVFKRYDAKKGKVPPTGFISAQEPDPVTGHWPGWLPIGEGPEDQWFREAMQTGIPSNGTYELCGPKVQGNPEGFDKHVFVRHGLEGIPEDPRTFEEIRDFLRERRIEGIVWHHPDGRMVKIKKKDFA